MTTEKKQPEPAPLQQNAPNRPPRECTCKPARQIVGNRLYEFHEQWCLTARKVEVFT